MKQVRLDDFGLPFNNDVIVNLQSNMIEALKVIVEAMAVYNPNGYAIILSGCVITKTGGNIVNTDGYVYYQGEIFQIDAGSVTDNTINRWEIVETYDALGDFTYEDTNVRHTQIIRKLKISNITSSVESEKFYSYMRLEDVGDRKRSTVSLNGFVTGVTYVSIDKGGRVFFMPPSVGLTTVVTTASQVLFTIDPEFRPAATKTFIVAVVNPPSGDRVFKHVEVQAGGDVVIYGLDDVGGGTKYIFLDGITFNRGLAQFT